MQQLPARRLGLGMKSRNGCEEVSGQGGSVDWVVEETIEQFKGEAVGGSKTSCLMGESLGPVDVAGEISSLEE